MAVLTMSILTMNILTWRYYTYYGSTYYDTQAAVVPLHERLGHCGESGANVRSVSSKLNPEPTPNPIPQPPSLP